MKYKATINEMKERGRGNWIDTNSIDVEINAQNAYEAEEKLAKKLEPEMKPGHYYTIEVHVKRRAKPKVTKLEDAPKKKTAKKKPAVKKAVKKKEATKKKVVAGSIIATLPKGRHKTKTFANVKEAATHFGVATGSIAHALKRGTASPTGKLAGIQFTKEA